MKDILVKWAVKAAIAVGLMSFVLTFSPKVVGQETKPAQPSLDEELELDELTAPQSNASSSSSNTSKAAAEPAAEVRLSSDNLNSDGLDSFLEAQKSKQYRGQKIFLRMTDADIRDVFRAISEASGFSIVVSEEVKGKVTVNLDQVPWDQSLDILLQSNKLAAERNGGVLRVTTLAALTNEKIAEDAAKKIAEATEPVVVKIFPISYGKLDDLKKILDDFLSKDASSANASEKRGSIQVDPRTNSLVVKETPTNMEKIARIVKELDTQTPQILIEAKFVEVGEERNKDVEGRIFSTSREFDSGTNTWGFKNRNNFGSLFGGQGFGAASSLATSFAVSPVAGASFGFQPRAGIIPGLREIGAFLSILESEETAKIIASPRVIAQNKEPAEISQGQTIQLPTTPGANAQGTFMTVNAVLRLQVVPQVTNEGTVNLKIVFSQETPSAIGGTNFTTDTKKVDTSVLVDSGSTLVIGGIYSSITRNSEGGIPFLRDIPILGVFFGSKKSFVKKSELFIFLTPRVLNEKEAGIQG